MRSIIEPKANSEKSLAKLGSEISSSEARREKFCLRAALGAVWVSVWRWWKGRGCERG